MSLWHFVHFYETVPQWHHWFYNILSLSEPLWAFLSLFEPFSASLSHSKPYWLSFCISGAHWNSLTLSMSFWTSLCLSDAVPLWFSLCLWHSVCLWTFFDTPTLWLPLSDTCVSIAISLSWGYDLLVVSPCKSVSITCTAVHCHSCVYLTLFISHKHSLSSLTLSVHPL